MYNLLIALTVGASLFGASVSFVHPWYAGVLPGIIGLLLTYVLLLGWLDEG